MCNFAAYMKQTALIAFFLMSASVLSAQHRVSLLDSLNYRVERELTASVGDHAPLWLHANKYGLSSLKSTNGYLRWAVERPLSRDSARHWALGYGVDMALASRFTSRLVVQQAYAEVRWLKGVLTIGSREQPMELKDPMLSSGSQTLGINARPVPQVRLSLPDYWTIPGTRRWLAIKGHIAYGKTTDDHWQTSFTERQHKYTQGTLYHSKAGYLRIGNSDVTIVSLELGLEMAAQFGGTSYLRDADGLMKAYQNQGGLKGMLKAFIPGGGGDVIETTNRNSTGNTLGSWLARFNFDSEEWGFSLYADHFFEDQSALTHISPDGYGEGEQWNTQVRRRNNLYAFRDMLWGLELRFPQQRWLSKMVFEYLYTKYQSGAMYHDHDQSLPDQIAGLDNYYNHYLFTGWQHWGEVMGNPLYTSPIYNSDHRIAVENNRMVACHLGIMGCPTTQFCYRLLATYQRGYGTYWAPFADPRHNVSLLAEGVWRLPDGRGWFKGWSVKGALAMDQGSLLGHNYGMQIALIRHGLLTWKKKNRKR